MAFLDLLQALGPGWQETSIYDCGQNQADTGGGESKTLMRSLLASVPVRLFLDQTYLKIQWSPKGSLCFKGTNHTGSLRVP